MSRDPCEHNPDSWPAVSPESSQQQKDINKLYSETFPKWVKHAVKKVEKQLDCIQHQLQPSSLLSATMRFSSTTNS